MRRGLLPGVAAVAALVVGSPAVGGETSPRGGTQLQPHEPRLTVRPGAGGGASCRPGTHVLRLGPGRTALMRIGPGVPAAGRPLVLALHGARGDSSAGLWVFREGWRTQGLVLVAPASEGNSWNLFLGSDLNSIDRALEQAFRRCRIDRRRIAVGGFSDGATTALTLGLSNGDVFRSVVAIAPGGVIAAEPVGKPLVYVAHGMRDPVIPFRVGREVVRELRRFDYRVTFRTFAGGHEVPASISRGAVRWFLDR